MKIFPTTLLLVLAFLLCAVQSRAQYIVAGSPLVYSNSYATTGIPLNLTLNSGAHLISATHSGLLTTTNMSAYFNVAIVDAITGATNNINIAQVWQAQNTNAATESITLSNYSFTVNGRILWTTTNAMNLPNSIGAVTYVTNSAVLQY